ncbi:MAG: GIY-YIG nuclease family protein [Armatimonadota bacterium]|nr:GIY-YIG nuclease family protein [Armatimonadota bacterium]
MSVDLPSEVEIVARYTINSLPPKKKNEKTCAVYIIRNIVSGKLYVGSSDDVARRFQAHISHLRRGVHCALLLQNSWLFHGEAAFEFIIVDVLPSADGLIEREQEIIDYLNPVFNSAKCAENPMTGRRHSAESIEKMRVARTGKGLGPRVFSDQHRAALSAALKGKPRPELRGIKRSDEVRQRMSTSAKKKFAEGFLNARARPIKIGGSVFRTQIIAAKHFGKSPSTITHWLQRGKAVFVDVTVQPTQL